MAKHTAGPWRVEGPADFPNPNVGMWQVEGATNICTHCTLYDARLIAAAPDLAQAAEDAEQGISEAVRIMDLMGRGQDARNLAIYGNNLRAALRRLEA